MSTLTIKQGNESYKVNAASEFTPNFAKHILRGEAVSVFDEDGKLIGGNPGKSGELHGWYIKHPDVINDEIKAIFLRRFESIWNYTL